MAGKTENITTVNNRVHNRLTNILSQGDTSGWCEKMIFSINCVEYGIFI